ncbi:hypothetical protein GCM10011351_25560 [Paraliobacillus quinghaiensis]|uniref:Uncharacterized protein n=1 Tax=Paraliobacillus quinghaiensis TaxID=470815 RepID=A0A917WXZ0_9BACI|nr:hypothetical protein GCM10011351_25560 [Paraliobacillus quinghaiensis]
MVKIIPNQNVKVDYFDNQLKSKDGQLQSNISPYTQIVLINGQPFSSTLTNRNLVVVYCPVTKKCPCQNYPL